MTDNYVQKVRGLLAERLPDCDLPLVDLYTLLALTKGVNTTLEDVHDAWAVWRNVTKPDHKSLVAFQNLSKEVQELDRPYMEAIHDVSGVPMEDGRSGSILFYKTLNG
jgi:hypothetical protein